MFENYGWIKSVTGSNKNQLPVCNFKFFSDLGDITFFGSIRIARFSHLYNSGFNHAFFSEIKAVSRLQ